MCDSEVRERERVREKEREREREREKRREREFRSACSGCDDKAESARGR